VNTDYLLDEIGASDDVQMDWGESNRLFEAAVIDQQTAGVTPEDGTTYTARWYATETIPKLLRTESGIAASTGSQTATMTVAEEEASGNYLGYLSPSYRVEIEAVRDGFISTTYVRELTREGGTGGLIHIDNILPAQVFEDPYAISDSVDFIAVEIFS
jgi:hypothetical protein